MKIQKEYGHNIHIPWKERIKFRLGEGLKLFLASLIVILFFPLIFILVIVFAIIGNGNININNILRFILRKDE